MGKPFPPGLHAYVLTRDKGCLLARIDTAHVCRDRWGDAHDSRDLDRLTLEHVKDSLAMGKRAPSDARHLVALCHSGNCKPPSRDERAAFRAHLAEVEGAQA